MTPLVGENSALPIDDRGWEWSRREVRAQGLDLLHLAGRPLLAASLGRPQRMTTIEVEWIERGPVPSVNKDGYGPTVGEDRRMSNVCQIVREHRRWKDGEEDDAGPITVPRVQFELLEKASALLELTLDHGERNTAMGPGKYVRNMAGVRELFGEPYCPAKHDLQLAVLREPKVLYAYLTHVETGAVNHVLDLIVEVSLIARWRPQSPRFVGARA